ncbi:hypothetical protein G7076_04450 [Sphingomonas sp. HDW15A]|uniref:hypothetical protein n=1 Tax=Sphingomonas sp. HDW15A TaxID=2714942 RepID=UPI00140915EA|nr:hypothetical protein [Sphingomonas sp. HDW15A]QIK95815.1 hypothetical protein G7076_04450 [Sphingomonas sp. HDW15A]
MLSKSGRTLAALGLSVSLAAYPTMSAAATSAPAQVNPFAVMSAFGSPASAAALCGNAAPAAAAGVAAAAQAPAPGCVLPVVETVAPVGQELPPRSPMVAVGNNAILPALLVISGLAAWALLFGLQDDDDDGNDFVPVSPA